MLDIIRQRAMPITFRTTRLCWAVCRWSSSSNALQCDALHGWLEMTPARLRMRSSQRFGFQLESRKTEKLPARDNLVTNTSDFLGYMTALFGDGFKT
jgi:hypothetical protein